MSVRALPAGALAVSSITIDGAAVDLGDVLADVTIRHGRTGYFDSASPSTCELTLLGVTRAFTRPFRLGALLVVNASDGSTAAPRFTGRFTDSDLELDVLRAIAVGRLRTLSGYTIGAGAYPEETWSSRVTRAFTDAGLASSLVLQVGLFNPTLLARAAEPVDLAGYLDELAVDVQSAVADLPDGRILVQSLATRTLSTMGLLDPAEVAYAPEWLQRLPGSNVVTVRYGNPEASVTVTDAASVAIYGPIAVEISTTLKLLADADTMARNRLARDAYSHWTVPACSLLYGRRFTVGQALELEELPPAAPFDPWTPILEGWTDRIASDGVELVWTMELALSDPLLSGLTIPWQAVPSALHWNTIDPTVAWRDALTLDDLEP